MEYGFLFACPAKSSAPPEVAQPMYLKFVDALKALGVPVATGVFRAEMAVELVNDGPVTVIIERE